MNTYLGLAPFKSNAYNSSVFAGDNDFGPILELPGKITFDFTLLFEETILSILPSAIFLLLIPPRVLHLWKTPRKVTANYLQTAKIISLALFSILQVVNVIEVSKSSLRTRASLAAAILTLATALGLCLLSHFEHIKNIRPSSIINAYLLLTLPFDTAQLRTRWLRGDDLAENGVSTAILAIKILVLISEAVEKRSLIVVPFADPSPEATSGLYSRGLFWWLTPLFMLGFKNVVNDDDLFVADRELLSKSLEIRFTKHWANRNSYSKSHTLLRVVTRTMLKPLTAAILPRLILTFLRFMQPFLIRNITQLVDEPDSISARNRGWGLTAATGLIYIGLAIIGGVFQHKNNRMATMVRGVLVNAIYSQTLDLSITNLDESAALTLMSSDVERICEAIQSVHSLWSSPLEIALAIWLLQNEIGLALLGPLFVTAIAVSGPFFMGKFMGAAQMIWIERIQTRIDITAKMLQSMKGVKMLGLSSKVSSIVTHLRFDEVASSLKMRKLFLVMIAFGNMSDIFAPGAAFALYVIAARINGQILDVTSAFTALSLIALLVAPIRSIVFSIPPLIAAVSCFDRIEAFISSPIKKDHRVLVPLPQGSTPERSELGSVAQNTILAADMDLDEFIEDTRESSTPKTNGIPSPATVRVENLTLAWSEEEPPVINDVSITFQPGNLTMIVGPVGSGKSTLLRGLLGETPSSNGNVYIDRVHAAFVGQNPWIQNDTIRNNIIGTSNFETAWYDKVVHACAFDTDLETFPGGDSTKAGSTGSALSGGQKLRIALARAVYSRQQILILDDVFSGLDAISEEYIFSRLLGKNGLLRQLGKTVILVTHAAHRLSYADHIIALDPHGTISEQGKFEQLISSDGYVAGLAARRIEEGEDTPKEEPSSSKMIVDEDTARLNAYADLNRPVGEWPVYKYYLKSAGKTNVIVWVGLMICYSVLMRFPDMWIKFWTSAIAIHGNSVNGLYLGILVLLEFVAISFLMALAALLFLTMIPRTATDMHSQLLLTISNAPLSFFTTTDTGQTLNRFSQDLSVLDTELPLAGLILSHQFCLAIIQAAFICISTPYFSSVLPFVLLIMYFLQKFYLRTSRQIRLMDLSAKAPLYTHFLETLSGLLTIRAFGWTTPMKAINQNYLDASQRPFYLLYCIQRWLALVIDLLVAFLAIILVFLIVHFRQGIDAGFVGVALINIMGFNITLSECIKNWTAIETSLGAVSRIKTFVETTASENLSREIEPVPQNWPDKGGITISNLEARYSSDLPPALKNLTLEITPGQKIGICGPSGSGKSSFVASLFHMLEITDGSIRIDEIDISHLPRPRLRSALTILPQEPIFLPGSIRQNLDPYDAVESDTILLDAVAKVGLKPVIGNAGSLDQRMDPESLLSHGQKQLFSLARTILHPSRIIVVDEATASVDLETERLVQKVLLEEFGGSTVIAIAHRLETIRNFDRVVVFGDGEVVEVGEPGELLGRRGGKFRELWEA